MKAKSWGGLVVGKTSNAVKDRWNRKTYEEIKVRFPRGRKAEVDAYAKGIGFSINGFICELVRERIGMTEEEWKRKPTLSDGETTEKE